MPTLGYFFKSFDLPVNYEISFFEASRFVSSGVDLRSVLRDDFANVFIALCGQGSDSASVALY